MELGLGERWEGLEPALASRRTTGRLPQVLIIQGMFIKLSEGQFSRLETEVSKPLSEPERLAFPWAVISHFLSQAPAAGFACEQS